MKKSRLAHRKNIKSKKKKNYFKYILLLGTFILVLVLVSFFTSRTWDSKSRLGIARQEKDGGVTITLLDPTASSITTIVIPKETEVTASHQLGTWKLGSIWKLGNDQKFGGNFLKDTIIKSFEFPLDAWEGGGKSSLSIWDQLEIALFKLGIKDSQMTNLNLKDTNYLIKTKLSDGSMGYKISEKMPVYLSSYFVDTDLFKKNFNLVITNATGSDTTALRLGEIVEVLGVKVTSIQKIQPTTDDCTISGTQKAAVAKIAKIFSCKVVSDNKQNNFDIEINIGKSFKDRF